jgi:hypothetical protein
MGVMIAPSSAKSGVSYLPTVEAGAVLPCTLYPKVDRNSLSCEYPAIMPRILLLSRCVVTLLLAELGMSWIYRWIA